MTHGVDDAPAASESTASPDDERKGEGEDSAERSPANIDNEWLALHQKPGIEVSLTRRGWARGIQSQMVLKLGSLAYI